MEMEWKPRILNRFTTSKDCAVDGVRENSVLYFQSNDLIILLHSLCFIVLSFIYTKCLRSLKKYDWTTNLSPVAMWTTTRNSYWKFQLLTGLLLLFQAMEMEVETLATTTAAKMVTLMRETLMATEMAMETFSQTRMDLTMETSIPEMITEMLMATVCQGWKYMEC